MKESVREAETKYTLEETKMTCDDFDPLVPGGSYDCSSHNEFGRCNLTCSTGKFISAQQI